MFKSDTSGWTLSPPLSRYSRTVNISWGASLRKTLHWGYCPFDQLALLGLLEPSFLKILRTYFKLPYKVSSQSFPFWAIYLFHISHDHSFWKIRKPIKSACLLDHTELISSGNRPPQAFSHLIIGPFIPTYLEKAMAPHSSTLAWKTPWTEEPGGLQSMGSLGVEHDWATSLWLFTFMHWSRKWQPTPVFLPGESNGQRRLLGCCLWGRTESDTTEAT